MASIDPETGKEPSGAAKRKIKHQARSEKIAAMGLKPDTGRWAKDFEAAGKPDLENPGTDLDYVRRLQLICLRQMATVAFPPIAQQEAWRRIKDMSATVGMTSNRAQLESKVRKLERSLAERRQDSSIVSIQHGSKVSKPSTARGQAPAGPRPLPDNSSVTSTDEE